MGLKSYNGNILGGQVRIHEITDTTGNGVATNTNLTDSIPSVDRDHLIQNVWIEAPAEYYPQKVVVTGSAISTPLVYEFELGTTAPPSHYLDYRIDFATPTQVSPSNTEWTEIIPSTNGETFNFEVTYASIASASGGGADQSVPDLRSYNGNVAGGAVRLMEVIDTTGNGVSTNIVLNDLTPNTSIAPLSVNAYLISTAYFDAPPNYYPQKVVITGSDIATPIEHEFTTIGSREEPFDYLDYQIDFATVTQVTPSNKEYTPIIPSGNGETFHFEVTFALINPTGGTRLYTPTVAGGQVEVINTDGTSFILNDSEPSVSNNTEIAKLIVTPPSTYALSYVIIKGTNLGSSPNFNVDQAEGYYPYEIDFSNYPHTPDDGTIEFALTFQGPIANPPQVSIGTPQVSIGTPQVSIGSGGGSVSVGASIGSGGGALQDLANTRAETGLFGSLSEAELLEMRADIIKQIKAVMSGDLVISVGIAGKQVTKKLPELAELKELLTEVNNQLKQIDPQKYGKKRRRFGFDHRFRRT